MVQSAAGSCAWVKHGTQLIEGYSWDLSSFHLVASSVNMPLGHKWIFIWIIHKLFKEGKLIPSSEWSFGFEFLEYQLPIVLDETFLKQERYQTQLLELPISTWYIPWNYSWSPGCWNQFSRRKQLLQGVDSIEFGDAQPKPGVGDPPILHALREKSWPPSPWWFWGTSSLIGNALEEPPWCADINQEWHHYTGNMEGCVWCISVLANSVVLN